VSPLSPPPLPRAAEGLQNLLNERKIIRAALKTGEEESKVLPPLEIAQILLEGGVIAYDTNLVTGGFGAKYFGAGGFVEYRVDQVRIYLRAVDVRTGRILKSVSTTKSVLSREVDAGVFRFVSYKRLLEVETGLTTNEPAQLAVLGAIEKAVASLIIEGLLEKIWILQNPEDMRSPVIQQYLEDRNLSVAQELQPLAKVNIR
jgi:curli production assembly/transport component CsgG